MKIEQIYNKPVAQIGKGDKIWAYVLKNYADSVLLDIEGTQVKAKIAGSLGKLSGWIHIKLVSLNPPSFEVIPASDRSPDITFPVKSLNPNQSEKALVVGLKNWFNSSEGVIKVLVRLAGDSLGKTLEENLSKILHFYDNANQIQREKIDHVLSFYAKQSTTIGNVTVYRFPLIFNNKNGSAFVKVDEKRLDIVVNIQLDKLGKIRLVFSDSSDKLNISISVDKRFDRFFSDWNDNIHKLLSDYHKTVDIKFLQLNDSNNSSHNIEYWA